MYGLVNKAVQGLISSEYGEEAWETIKAASGVEVDLFISNEPYDDAVTYSLVTKASEHLDQPVGELLRKLGHYWIFSVAAQYYGALLTSGGKSFGDFLKNLPNFHRRVAMIFPQLEPPVFYLQNETGNSVEMVYHSKRPGLEMLLVGILEALAIRYQQKTTITQLEDLVSSDDSVPSDRVFKIEWED